MRTLYVSLLVTMAIAGCSGGGTTIDTINRKIATAFCMKDTAMQTLTLELYIAFNGNQVDRVMALSGDTFVVSNTGTTNEVTCDKSDITQGNVAITSTVSVSSNVNNNNNGCGARRTTGNNFKWVIEVRSLYSQGVYFGIDRRYHITCDYDSVPNKYLTAQINVIGQDLTGTSERLNPVNTMSVLGQQPNNGAFLVTDTVQLDQYAKLQITSSVSSAPTNRDPYGVYAFECDFGPLTRSERTVFIATNGCPVAGNSFRITNGFKFTQVGSPTNGMRLFYTLTDMFVMANSTTFPANNFYYLSCYLDYCFGTLGSDNKCTDFCDVSRTGRKRRELGDVNKADLDQISLAIEIIGKTETTTTTTVETEGEKSSRLAIIVASSAASVVFLIIVFIVVFLLCCYRGACCGSHDDELWEESTNSTVSTKRPGNLVYPQHSLAPTKA